MFKAVILRSRGQDSGRLSRQGFQRLAMGDPERLSLPPWENEKMGVRQESVWPVGCHLPSTVLVLWLSNHKPSSQASSGLYGSRFNCFLELSRLSACLQQRSEHPISILDLKPTLSTSSFICESKAQRSRVICPVSASRGD